MLLASHVESSLCNQAKLLEQSEVVLDVPVLGDAPIGNPIDVGGDKIDRLALCPYANHIRLVVDGEWGDAVARCGTCAD